VSPRRATAAVAALASFLLLVVVGCGKRPGAPCKEGESACSGKKTALACRSGKFAEVPCAGPLGCVKLQDRASCDTSVGKAGDACMGDGEDEHACTADKKRALVCKDGKLERSLECRGKGGCSVLGRTVSCDTTVAAKGDPCPQTGATACSEDQKEMLVCRDGTFVLYRHCRGQFGCFVKGDDPSCDETLSVEGDPCGMPGQVVCSLDGQSELVCQGGAFVRTRGCKTGCSVTNRAGRPIDCQ
jgi:hypothetical protein